MKIPIKFKQHELLALVALLDQLAEEDTCESRTEAIVKMLVLKFQIRLKQKSLVMDKPRLTIQVDAETAMALVEYLETSRYDSTSLKGIVAGRLIAHCDPITSHFY